MYNKKLLKTVTGNLDKAKAPVQKKDIPFDPSGKGMLNPNYAGKPVKLATDTLYNPTPYTINAYADNGMSAVLNPFDTRDVSFPGAQYVYEDPSLKKGGSKKNSKSLLATNRLYKKNPLFKKPNHKGKTFDPSAMYFEDGGYIDAELTEEEIEELRKGGYIVQDISVPELSKAQKGQQVKPLEISDPKEFAYRNKMYADSSNLYKAYQMQDKLMGPGNYKTKDKYKWNTAELKEGRKKKIVKGLEDYGPISQDFQSEADQFKNGYNAWTARKEDKQLLDYYKKLGFKPNQIMYHSSPDLVNDKIKAVGSYFDGNAISPIYKKPKQPVVFKEISANETVNNIPDPNRKVIGENSITQLDVNGKPVTTIEYVYEDQVPAKQSSVPPTKVVASMVQPKSVMPDKGTAYRTQTVMYPDGTYELRQVPYWKSGEHNAQTGSKHLNPPGVVNATDLSPEELQTLKKKDKLNSKKEGGALLTKKVTCKKCGWKWDAADGGSDITTCHKCGGQGLIHAQVGVTVDNEEPKRRRFVPGTYNPETTLGYVEELPEAEAEAKAPEWLIYAREYEKKNSKQDFINDKKREYLKRNTGLNKAAGVTMDNFPETVEQNFAGEYEYKRNSYIAKRYGKKHGFNPKRRGEWVEQLSPGTKAVIGNSKYGSKLQPSYWARAAAGVQNLQNMILPGKQPYVQIPGLTEKEQREILNDDFGALEIAAPFDLLGASIAGALKNRGISTGFDYRELPGIFSGEKMFNVDDRDAIALNPLNLSGIEAIPEMGINMIREIGSTARALPAAYSAGKKFFTKGKPFTKADDAWTFKPQEGYTYSNQGTPQVTSTQPKVLDTQVPLYRVENEGATFSPNKFADEYHDLDFGPVEKMAEEELKQWESNPNFHIYTDIDGEQRAGVFFPQHTAGNWWSNVPLNSPGAPGIVGGQNAYKGKPLLQFTSQVPFSQLNKFSVKNDPSALGYAGQPEKEFILPPEYKNSATVEPFIEEGFSRPVIDLVNETKAVEKTPVPPVRTKRKYNVKGEEARKQFLKDLQQDADYNIFKQNAQITDPQTGAIHSSFGVPNIQNDFFKGQGLSEENGIYGIAAQEQLGQKIAGTDDQVVSTVFNDIRDRKVDLWQSPEGQQRLQQVIDNTPSLAGQTPQSMVERLVSVNNTNTARLQNESRIAAIKNEMDQLDLYHADNIINDNDYVSRSMQLEDELKAVEENIDLINKDKSSGSYNVETNTVNINPEIWAKGDLGKLTAHELGHVLGGIEKGAGPTNLDEMLGGLELVKDKSRQLSIPGLENAEEVSGAHGLFGHAKDNYIDESIDYFKNGSSGSEKVPMVSEIRQDMLEKGLIDNEYATITPKLLKEHFKDYKKTRGAKFPLRIYDIMKDKPDNFNLLSKTLNYLPQLVGGLAVLDQVTDENSDTSEAGIGLAVLLGGFSKKPGVRLPKKALQLGAKALKEGVVNLTRPEKKYLDQIVDLEKLAKTKGEVLYRQDSPLNLALREARIKTKTLGDKVLNQLDKKTRKFVKNGPYNDTFYDEPTAIVNDKLAKLNEYDKQLNAFEKTEEGLKQEVPNLFEAVNPSEKPVVNTGQKQITDFTTGEKINAEVKLPVGKLEYKKIDGKLSIEDTSTKEPKISPEYSKALSDNINKVQTDIPGAKVFGSSVLVTEAGMPHLTDDLDVLITESDFNKHVKKKYKHLGANGPAEKYSVYPQYGEEGVLDMNVIHEDSYGNVKPLYYANMPGKTPMEIELFRQFYPKEFQEASKQALKTGQPLKINMKASDFIAGIDPKVKTVMDAYEASPYNKFGGMNFNKVKHVNRPDVLIAFGEPNVVAKGQEAFVKSLVGPDGKLGHQFTKDELSDVGANTKILDEMGYLGDNIAIANDPERMQLALNDYFINNSIFSREITIPKGTKNIEEFVTKALTEWVPGKGGSFNGIGLNTIRLGDPNHINLVDKPIIGHRQLGLKLDTSNPKAYVKSIIRSTNGNYVFTPEELNTVQEIFRKYLPDYEHKIKYLQKPSDILYMDIITPDLNKGNEALKELHAKTGIRALTKDKSSNSIRGDYGNSVYSSVIGDFDEAVDAMMYSLKELHAAPKSMVTRTEQLEAKNRILSSKVPSFNAIKVIGDYDKITNLLNKGRETASFRLTKAQEIKFNIEKQKEDLQRRFMSGKAEVKELNKLTAESKKLEKEIESLIKETETLEQKVKKIKDNKRKILQISLGVGTVGSTFAGLTMLMMDREKELQEAEEWSKDFYKALPILKERGIEKEWLEPLPDIAEKYLVKYPNAKTWPTGEPISNYASWALEPESMHYSRAARDYVWNRGNKKYKKPEKKYGGVSNNSMELELSPEEIKDYLSRGYVIEEID